MAKSPAPNAVSPALLAEILLAAWSIKEPAFVWGPPGGGKSSIVKQTAALFVAGKLPGYTADPFGNLSDPQGELVDPRRWFLDLRAAQLDPVDVRGIPIPKDGRTTWAIPSIFPIADDWFLPVGVIFLDEITKGADIVQSAFLQLVLDRCLGEYQVPAGWVVTAASNRVSDGSFDRKLSKALGTRFPVHVELSTTYDDWKVHAIRSGVSALTLGFLEALPQHLHNADANRDGNSFPCERVWTELDKVLQVLPEHAKLPVLCGAVGEGVATEYKAFVDRCRALPDPDLCITQPETAPVPTEPDLQYVVAIALARKLTPKTADAIITYAGRLAVEINLLLVQEGYIGNNDTDKTAIRKTKGFTAWAVKHQEAILGGAFS